MKKKASKTLQRGHWPKPGPKVGRTSSRRPVGRRSTTNELFPGADYQADEAEFLKAVDAHRRATGKRFLLATEIFTVLKALGYRKA